MTTAVRTCAASACAFNAETSCNALAITVAGSDRTPGCGTFVQLDVRRPVTEGASTVGACHRLECTYNADLACTAEGIEVTDVAATAGRDPGAGRPPLRGGVSRSCRWRRWPRP